jgi:molybdate transport system substrate-binding protein
MSNTKITVLSAGAVEPGLAKIIDPFRRETGHDVKIAFATAPAILERLAGANISDVVIAPLGVLREWEKTRKPASGDQVTVGRIGVGIVVRDGALLPKIATVSEFKQSLLSSEWLVYNQASTGIYLEGLFERLGIAAQLKSKTTRYPDAGAVLNHVSKGNGNEIGLAALTVIIESERNGLKLVGPLPPEIQNYTSYAAVVSRDSRVFDAAQEFVRYLASPEAKKALSAAGIE